MNRQTTFYFGADCGIDDPVSDGQFLQFLSNAVVLYFPGFTITESKGWWEGKPERVRVLTIIHGPDDADRCTKIAETYRDRFSQSSVLVTTIDVDARLV